MLRNRCALDRVRAGVVVLRIIELFFLVVGEGRVGINLLDEVGKYRQGHRGSLSVSHTVEGNAAFLAAYPGTCHQTRRKGHEPAVGVVVGGTGLACQRSRDVVAEADALACAVIDDIAQNRQHLQVGIEREYFLAARRKAGKLDAVVVGNTLHVKRRNTLSVAHKRTVGCYHFLDRDIAHTQAKRKNRIQLVADAHTVQHAHKGFGRKLRHHSGGDPVVGVHQTPLEGYHLADTFLAGIAGCPGPAVCIVQNRLRVQLLVAGRASFLHRQRIEQRLDGGTYLTPSGCYHIVLEEREVRSADVCFHIT